MVNLAHPLGSPQDGLEPRLSFDRKRLEKELMGLRTREGLVYWRVEPCTELTSLAYVWRQTQPPALASLDDVQAAIAMIKSTLEGERPAGDRESLQVAYGLGGFDGRSWSKRIGRYLEQSEDQKEVYSKSTIERRSKIMAKRLAARLISLVTSAQALQTRGAQAAVDSSQDALREPFTMDSVQVSYRMGPGRFLRDIRYRRHVTCLTSGNHCYVMTNTHYSDPRPGVHRLEPEFGCGLVSEHYENGAYITKLRLKKTLEVGESFEFAYRIVVAADNPCSNFVLAAQSMNVGKWSISIEFANDEGPNSYWTFQRLSYFAAMNRVNRRETACAHDGSGYIGVSWQDLSKGSCYGVDWDW